MQNRLSVGFVVIFYLILTAVGWGVGQFFGLDVLSWHNDHHTTILFDAGLGVMVGLVVVIASQLVDRWAEWAREMSREFGRLLGQLHLIEVFVFALASAIGEEVFFRGFLQQLLSSVAFSGRWANWAGLVIASLIFGLLHLGPDLKKFWPWTLFAVVMGISFGWMFLYTGNILAPALAHFTVNFFNLHFISSKYGDVEAANGL